MTKHVVIKESVQSKEIQRVQNSGEHSKVQLQ